MKIFLIGNGGRENALAYGIYNSSSFKKNNSVLYSTIGSPGLNKISIPVDIKPTDLNALVNFALNEKIDFTVVGPEIPLSMGIVDEFEKKGLKIFGPSKTASEIESSKAFAKDLMNKYGIPTAGYKIFDERNKNDIDEFISKSDYPLVIKADGLAAGKGVLIVNDVEEARMAVKEITEDKIFGDSGNKIIIEEYLEGFELSLFVITDGNDFILLPYSQDHKKIGEGDTGKNTGGMGAYAPANELINENISDDIIRKIVEPTLSGMKESGRLYKGCLYCGLMITKDYKPYVIEFNCRFGDPETQAVVPLIKSDFLEMLIASSDGKMKEYKPEFYNEYACCVILSSKGYPDKYETGKVINGLEDNLNGGIVFHSGTKQSGTGEAVTNGGRVLSVVSLSSTSMKDAIEKCYINVGKINFENKYFRRDIGSKYFDILTFLNKQ